MGLIYGYHPNWESFIYSADVQKEIREIERFLETEEYFPSEDNVLRFLRQDPVKTKAVIVGMEPYPSSFVENGAVVPETTGRSFEVASIREWTDKFK